MDLARFAMNQITTPRWSLPEAIQGYARQGVRGIGVWRDKLQECGVRAARTLLAAEGMWVPSLCKTGDVAQMSLRGSSAALDDCLRAIDEAHEIGAAAVVFVSGGTLGCADIDLARGRVSDLLLAAREHAGHAGVSLGIEPFHPMHAAERGCVNTLAQAHRLRERVGPQASVVFDVFHSWWEPDLAQFLAAPYLGHICTVQLCDWRVPTRHPVHDRAMFGDGAANVAALVRRLEGNGYAGPYEAEIFSTDWWSRDPEEVVRVCVERFEALGRRGPSGISG